MSAPAAPDAGGGPYGELLADRIAETAEQLRQRVAERFPDSGLSRVAAQLTLIARETDDVVQRLRRPIWPLRIAAGVAIVAIVALVGVLVAMAVRVGMQVGSLAEIVQASEAATNELVFLSIAIFFLVSLETRVKRQRVLRALHRLRSIVHIVDMHQLTKDPEHLLSPRRDTASSPRRTLGRFELARYLDYCSEMLSLSSKLAALHVQYVNDPVVLDAVNDIETLAASLSSKIWQKIMILDTVAGAPPAPPPFRADTQGL